MATRAICFAAALVATSACASSGTAPAPPATAASAAGAPEVPGLVGIRSLCGFTFVGNDGPAHFTLEVAAGQVKHQSQGENDLYVVDDAVLQVQLVTRKQIGYVADGKAGVELLRAHEMWEAAHLARIAGSTLDTNEREWELKTRQGATRRGIAWQIALPANLKVAPGVTAPLTATTEMGGAVLALTLQGLKSQPRAELMATLERWLRTIAMSARAVDVKALTGELRARAEAGDECRDEGVVDRGLRLAKVSDEERALLEAFAAREGGVERRTVGGRRRYRNNICRFQVDYPTGWKDYDVIDFNGRFCLLNLATPLIPDSDDGQQITNSITLVAAGSQPGFGREQLHASIADNFKKANVPSKRVTPPLLEGALHDSYRGERDGVKFVSELVTFQRGEHLYHLNLLSTPGTYARGRAHLLELLREFKWNVAPPELPSPGPQ